ncbi:MAG: tRNA pseudouridine(13) synthase TruD [Oleispira antarctica]|nr:tRNA pseudouridine(13) synthase TruD [Oleispira antarctica]MBQ0793638.1 tRNA pseudouridine(13) synthase TruD [Oleispira antarctica]
MWNFDWPKAYPETNAHGILKLTPEDFQVDEIPLMSPKGEGEHIYLHIKKREVNTHWVARLLSEEFGVKEHDVSYAGQKDRYAVTTQWFSIYAPKIERVLEARPFPEEDIEILVQTRHTKKLRRGDLIGNRFNIVLRNIKSSETSDSLPATDAASLQETIENNLQKIKLNGVPNYFGLQRFGRGGGNMDQALAMLTGQRREKNRQKKGIYLSAARSYIFNQVLAARIEQGLWGQAMAGDIDVSANETQDANKATAPMWGRGRLNSHTETLALEQAISEPLQDLCNGMEHAGLNQERREIVSSIENMQWQWLENSDSSADLNISFALASGHYATSVLQEFMQVEEPERYEETPFVYNQSKPEGELESEKQIKETHNQEESK